MHQETNKFGTGILYDESDIAWPIYAYGCACMSIQSEILSYANAHPSAFTRVAENAKSIVVLSCQVTDLTILNDIRTIERFQQNHPETDIYVGACLARRFDIEMRVGVRRLVPLRTDHQDIRCRLDVEWSKPFWVPGFTESEHDLAAGNLFRNMYPLRIGVGCHGCCTYCTIRITRGAPYELDTGSLLAEFLSHEDVVLIADNPTRKQILEWCNVALIHKKPISIRNLEPSTYSRVRSALWMLADAGYLKILHIPIQSTSPQILEDMGRDVDATVAVLADLPAWKRAGVIMATNIITDYKGMPNGSVPPFDYVSWNPYWDGKWDRAKAEERFERYFPSGRK